MKSLLYAALVRLLAQQGVADTDEVPEYIERRYWTQASPLLPYSFRDD